MTRLYSRVAFNYEAPPAGLLSASLSLLSRSRKFGRATYRRQVGKLASRRTIPSSNSATHNRTDNGFLIEFLMASEFQLRDDYIDASELLNHSISPELFTNL